MNQSKVVASQFLFGHILMEESLAEEKYRENSTNWKELKKFVSNCASQFHQAHLHIEL